MIDDYIANEIEQVCRSTLAEMSWRREGLHSVCDWHGWRLRVGPNSTSTWGTRDLVCYWTPVNSCGTTGSTIPWGRFLEHDGVVTDQKGCSQGVSNDAKEWLIGTLNNAREWSLSGFPDA